MIKIRNKILVIRCHWFLAVFLGLTFLSISLGPLAMFIVLYMFP